VGRTTNESSLIGASGAADMYLMPGQCDGPRKRLTRNPGGGAGSDGAATTDEDGGIGLEGEGEGVRHGSNLIEIFRNGLIGGQPTGEDDELKRTANANEPESLHPG